ncbi:hypothetical protein [Candidatus Blochmannia ocreatus (nom. nud.)]|uniref:Uncharacterized protein n=1 Tax=Candidatus Blochmannia ocreatus (nom. nud.) TaxID=251538 RepID=A0ABY4SYP5_9ENTR|nr:hypothetical protein [Candidatus Blochmannia ocreatus]URJ25383.1 hypothetical protein M9405_01535 [Candidatus Blochmannia ocreatus]
MTQYYILSPEPDNTSHKVRFGTSDHRNSSQWYSFNKAHILTISQINRKNTYTTRYQWTILYWKRCMHIPYPNQLLYLYLRC